MSVTILHRYTHAVLYSSATAGTTEAAVIEACGSGADLSGAYLHSACLRGADLSDAYLHSADLSDADLRGTKGLLDGPAPLQIGGSRDWIIVRQPGYITIGCEHRTLAWWRKHYEATARKEKYSNAQIVEYAAHIEYCAQWMTANGVAEVEVPA